MRGAKVKQEILDEIYAILSKYGEVPEYGEVYETAYPKLLSCIKAMEQKIAELTGMEKRLLEDYTGLVRCIADRCEGLTKEMWTKKD